MAYRFGLNQLRNGLAPPQGDLTKRSQWARRANFARDASLFQVFFVKR
jgi:hypothetical protein